MAKSNSMVLSSHIVSASQPQKDFAIAQDDRISELPDHILSHILSFLPTKISVMTSCLSKRWRFIWASVSVLDLDIRLFKQLHLRKKCKTEAIEEETLNNFMNKVLILGSDHICVRKFKLLLVSTYGPLDVDSWIQAAVTHNIEELHLSADLFLKLPMTVFNSETLVLLKLGGLVELIVPETASLPSLKVVHLDLFQLCDADINRLLSASPFLQELLIKLRSAQNIKRFSIFSSSLKTLMMGNQNRYHVSIDAPKLEYLEFIDTKGEGIDIEFKNAASIVKAVFHITGSNCCNVPEINTTASSLCSLQNVKVLSLSSFILKAVLSCGHDVRFNSLTKLVVGYCRADLSILPQILKRIPSLETLVLNKLSYCNHTVGSEEWKQEKGEIHCLKYSLKTLRLGWFEGNEQEMQMLKYFLENGNVLNEVRALSKLANNKELERAIMRKLSTYRRCSNALQVTIS